MAKRRSKAKECAIQHAKRCIAGVAHKQDGGIIKPYDLGHQAYFNGMQNTEAFRKGGSFWLGWRHALESDKRLHTQCSKEHVRASIESRMLAAYGVAA